MNSPDLFLEAHRVGPLQFNVSYPFTPISIRDQMIRGTELVRHAERAGILEPGGRLVVVGAGVAGVTCALQAAKLGAQVTIVDRALLPFATQRNCHSRWVDPVQYDWPAVHWDEGRFPKVKGETPMDFPEGIASDLVREWDWSLNKGVAQGIVWLPHTDFASVRVDRKNSVLTIGLVPRGRRSMSINCDWLIYAIGFGTEQSFLNRFEGSDFWDTDRFEEPHAGLSARSTNGRRATVKICGGGDGAAQDFLRIVTGFRSARSLLMSLVPRISADVLLRLYTLEDEARRTALWTQESGHRHRMLQELHDQHYQLALQIVMEKELNASVEKLLLERLQFLDIELLHPCTHFSECYALNRFLVQLLSCWAKLHGLPVSLSSTARLTDVEGAGLHRCGEGEPCEGNQHSLTLRFGVTCEQPAGNSQDYRTSDLLVLRRGVRRPVGVEHFFRAKGVQLSRQLLPYFPW